MKGALLGRRAVMFIAAMFVVALAISIVGLANVRPHAWPYVLRNPRELTQVFFIWIWPVLIVGFFALFSAFGRYLYKSRSVPQNYERWGDPVFSVMAVPIVVSQLMLTASAFAHWYREAHPMAPHPAPGATFLGLVPDPQHLVGRAFMAASGLFIAWMGNGMAKLVPSPYGRPEPYDRGKYLRLNGWVIALGGVAMVLCDFLLPYPIPVVIGALLVVGAMVALQALIWLVLRFGGGHHAVAPPEGL